MLPAKSLPLAAALVAAATVVAPSWVWAQAADPAAADRRLQELEDQLRRTQAEHEQIKRRAREISDELAKIRTDMVNAARAAQESEETLSELELQLDDLRALEAEKAETLQRRSQQMTGVLTALERLAWRPTEALLAQPQSPADTLRSAILLRAAVPQIDRSAQDLRGEIDMMARLRADVVDQRKRIATTAIRLEGEHSRLKDLWLRKSSLQSAAVAESDAAEQRVRALAGEAEDLRDLLARLEQERQRRLAEAVEKAAAEKAAREAEIIAKKAAREAEIAAEKAAREAEIAAKKAEKERKVREVAEAKAARQAELQAQEEAKRKVLEAEKAARQLETATREAAAAQPMTDGRQFSAGQGHMPFPARGKIVTRYGQNNELGVASKGLSIITRQGAQVVSPYDGQVAFAGPFRGYGLLLIIEHSEGYHTLLAGMARIDAQVGQRLLAGEPVGIMGQDEAKPTLYVELRRNGQPVNPLPWLTAQKSKVSG